jgi:hypothetical protein
MLLSARMLNGVADVNHFEVVPTLEFTQGDAPDIYFVLVDASVEKTKDPAYRRYCPAALATLQVTLRNVDSSISLTKTATQPFPTADTSIWKVSFNSVSDAAAIAGLKGTYALKLVLTEGTKVTTGFASQAINITSTNPEF